MTNNEKRAADLSLKCLGKTNSQLHDLVLEALTQARADAYREGAEKMREDAASAWDDCCFDAVGETIDIGKSIRKLPITPPQPAAQEEDDYTTCPECGGDADNGWSREVPPSAYVCSECEGREDDGREMRDAFEAWAKEQGYLWSHNLNYKNGKYRPPTVNTTFKAWQSACEWKDGK